MPLGCASELGTAMHSLPDCKEGHRSQSGSARHHWPCSSQLCFVRGHALELDTQQALQQQAALLMLLLLLLLRTMPSAVLQSLSLLCTAAMIASKHGKQSLTQLMRTLPESTQPGETCAG